VQCWNLCIGEARYHGVCITAHDGAGVKQYGWYHSSLIFNHSTTSACYFTKGILYNMVSYLCLFSSHFDIVMLSPEAYICTTKIKTHFIPYVGIFLYLVNKFKFMGN